MYFVQTEEHLTSKASFNSSQRAVRLQYGTKALRKPLAVYTTLC